MVFGMGEQRSFLFFRFLTMQDVCILRVTCFAVAVELHDTIEDLQINNITWPGSETDAPYEMRHDR